MKPEDIKKCVKEYAQTLNGEYNETQSGVPRIILTGKEYKISLVFVGKSKIWKAFFPYPAAPEKQERKYFKTTAEIMDFCREKGCALK